MKETHIKTTNKKRKLKKILLYILLAALSIIFIAAGVYFMFEQLKNTPVQFNIEDEETIYLEYGIDSLPEVTAVYRENQFTDEEIPAEVTMEGNIDLTKIGTYKVTYSASNQESITTIRQTYVIQDWTPPVITLTGGEIGYYSPGYSYIEAGFSAADNHDGDLTSEVIYTITPTEINYMVVDSFGNVATATRQLICQDIVPPSMALNGSQHIVIKKGSKFADPGCFAWDDVNGDISAYITVSGNIDTKTYGKQYLTYTSIDSSGNTSQIQRCVVVQETTPPTLSLKGSAAYVRIGDEYVEEGYQAFDNIDGDISSGVSVTGLLDTNTTGVYTLTYTATDSSLNTVTQTRVVYVFPPQSEEQKTTPPGKVVYLTFDDGPGPYTEQLLDKLDKYNVDATFFVTNQKPDYQHLIGETYHRGHTIALHTYTHNFSKVYASEKAYYEDLAAINMVVEQQTGKASNLLRFPGGSSNTVSRKYSQGLMTRLSKSVEEKGYRYCDWTIDSRDTNTAKTKEEVAQAVIAGIQKEADYYIVLQHDTKLYSIEALDEIFCWGYFNGVTFLPMTETSPMHHHDIAN